MILNESDSRKYLTKLSRTSSVFAIIRYYFQCDSPTYTGFSLQVHPALLRVCQDGEDPC